MYALIFNSNNYICSICSLKRCPTGYRYRETFLIDPIRAIIDLPTTSRKIFQRPSFYKCMFTFLIFIHILFLVIFKYEKTLLYLHREHILYICLIVVCLLLHSLAYTLIFNISIYLL